MGDSLGGGWGFEMLCIRLVFLRRRLFSWQEGRDEVIITWGKGGAYQELYLVWRFSGVCMCCLCHNSRLVTSDTEKDVQSTFFFCFDVTSFLPFFFR